MRKKLIYFLFLISLFCLYFSYQMYLETKKHDKKKFVFWSIQLQKDYMENIINEFETKNPEYKIVWVDIPIQEAQKRTLASILSSNPPDLINLNPDFSVILAQRNALEFFNEDSTKQFHPELVNKLRYENKIYALPFYATSPVTIYNKEIYDKCAKIPFIKTYDELFDISPKIYECSNKSTFAASLNENDTLAKILNKYDITTLQTENEQNQATMIYSQFNNMYKKGYLPKDILAVNHREVIEKYMSGQAAIIVAGSNFIKTIKTDANDTYLKSAIAPQLVGKNKGYDVSLMNLIIPKKAKNKEIALKFALFLTNKENQLELSRQTNVLPVNRFALTDDYFKHCPVDLVEKSRCIGASQLNNLVLKDFGDKNKKTINESINKTLEEILLEKNSSPDDIKERIFNLVLQIKNLIY